VALAKTRADSDANYKQRALFTSHISPGFRGAEVDSDLGEVEGDVLKCLRLDNQPQRTRI
jgi:hypothetical protein